MIRFPLAASQEISAAAPPIGCSDPPPSPGSAPRSEAMGAPHEAVRCSTVSEPTSFRYVARTGAITRTTGRAG